MAHDRDPAWVIPHWGRFRSHLGQIPPIFPSRRIRDDFSIERSTVLRKLCGSRQDFARVGV